MDRLTRIVKTRQLKVITKYIQKYSDEGEFETKMVKSLALKNPLDVPYLSQSAKENIIDVSRYSSLEKPLKVTPTCLRFVNNSKRVL